MTRVPHFALPFRFGAASGRVKVVVNEQGTIDEIFDSVEAIARYQRGYRREQPSFGITDQTFGNQPLNTDQMIREISEWDPRARVVIEQHPDRFDTLVAQLTADVFPASRGA